MLTLSRGQDRLDAMVERGIQKISTSDGSRLALCEVTGFSMDQAAQDTREVLVGNVRAWRPIMVRAVMQAVAEQQLREGSILRRGSSGSTAWFWGPCTSTAS